MAGRPVRLACGQGDLPFQRLDLAPAHQHRAGGRDIDRFRRTDTARCAVIRIGDNARGQRIAPRFQIRREIHGFKVTVERVALARAAHHGLPVDIEPVAVRRRNPDFRALHRRIHFDFQPEQHRLRAVERISAFPLCAHPLRTEAFVCHLVEHLCSLRKRVVYSRRTSRRGLFVPRSFFDCSISFFASQDAQSAPPCLKSFGQKGALSLYFFLRQTHADAH